MFQHPSALFRILFFALAFLMWPVLALAQETAFNLAPADPGLKEILGDTALSSGAAVHGVQLRVPGDAVPRDMMAPTPLMLYLPEVWLKGDAKVACLQTGSIDGRYAGGANYAWKEKIAGPQFAGYTTKQEDYLSALGPSELAVNLTRGPCEEQSIWAGTTAKKALQISVASWRHPFPSDTLEVLVNGFSSDEITLAVGGTGNTEVPCEEVSAPTRAAYNMACILPLADLDPFLQEDGSALVTVRNYTRGIAGRDVWLKLYVPRAEGG